MSSVRLNLYKNRYVSGERIEGTVDLLTNSRKTIDVVKVVLKGKGKTEWTERESYYDHKNELQHKDVIYYSEECYLNREFTLMQAKTELSPGTNTYTFSLMLPSDGLPSSYEGRYGKTRYYIKAVIVRSWNTDLVYKRPFEFSALLNLNYLPHLRNPITTSVDKTMWSCFCRDKGILLFNMSLPITGFVPGQEVHVGAHVENLTNVNTENVQFKIVQYFEFIARNPSHKKKYMEYVIATRTESGIGAHGEKSWTSILKIPAQKNYPNFDSCSIMKVSYRLKAKIIVATPHNNLENKVSLVIGGIPIEGVSASFSADPPPTVPVRTTSSEQAEATSESEKHSNDAL